MAIFARYDDLKKEIDALVAENDELKHLIQMLKENQELKSILRNQYNETNLIPKFESTRIDSTNPILNNAFQESHSWEQARFAPNTNFRVTVRRRLPSDNTPSTISSPISPGGGTMIRRSPPGPRVSTPLNLTDRAAGLQVVRFAPDTTTDGGTSSLYLQGGAAGQPNLPRQRGFCFQCPFPWHPHKPQLALPAPPTPSSSLAPLATQSATSQANFGLGNQSRSLPPPSPIIVVPYYSPPPGHSVTSDASSSTVTSAASNKSFYALNATEDTSSAASYQAPGYRSLPLPPGPGPFHQPNYSLPLGHKIPYGPLPSSPTITSGAFYDSIQGEPLSFGSGQQSAPPSPIFYAVNANDTSSFPAASYQARGHQSLPVPLPSTPSPFHQSNYSLPISNKLGYEPLPSSPPPYQSIQGEPLSIGSAYQSQPPSPIYYAVNVTDDASYQSAGRRAPGHQSLPLPPAPFHQPNYSLPLSNRPIYEPLPIAPTTSYQSGQRYSPGSADGQLWWDSYAPLHDETTMGSILSRRELFTNTQRTPLSAGTYFDENIDDSAFHRPVRPRPPPLQMPPPGFSPPFEYPPPMINPDLSPIPYVMFNPRRVGTNFYYPSPRRMLKFFPHLYQKLHEIPSPDMDQSQLHESPLSEAYFAPNIDETAFHRPVRPRPPPLQMPPQEVSPLLVYPPPMINPDASPIPYPNFNARREGTNFYYPSPFRMLMFFPDLYRKLYEVPATDMDQSQLHDDPLSEAYFAPNIDETAFHQPVRPRPPPLQMPPQEVSPLLVYPPPMINPDASPIPYPNFNARSEGTNFYYPSPLRMLMFFPDLYRKLYEVPATDMDQSQLTDQTQSHDEAPTGSTSFRRQLFTNSPQTPLVPGTFFHQFIDDSAFLRPVRSPPPQQVSPLFVYQPGMINPDASPLPYPAFDARSEGTNFYYPSPFHMLMFFPDLYRRLYEIPPPDMDQSQLTDQNQSQAASSQSPAVASQAFNQSQPMVVRPKERRGTDRQATSLSSTKSSRDPKLVTMERIVGEIAFQLDRRILSSIFPDRVRLYGFTVSSIPEKIQQAANDPLSPMSAEERQSMVERYDTIMNMLKPKGYDPNFHSKFTEHIVNTYGILKERPDAAGPEGDVYNNPSYLRQVIEQIVPPEKMTDCLTLLDCLSFMASTDGKPLFIW
ncbi:speriolin isoform X3 [Podarcis raffonei]|uniref:speriolin isoform X3 n=1 Tax=Podarcis raffonei TaxID=65483 RepID=UPI0023292159|nr:speriolin isoform X3 [Podarcis raffonei]